MKGISGSLSATGSVTLSNKPDTDTLTQVQVSGTYGTLAFLIEGTIDGANWTGLTAIRNDTRGHVVGSITPADNQTVIYDVASAGYVGVRARVTAIGSGTANFVVNSGAFAFQPAVVPPNATPGTIGAAGSTTTILGNLALGTTTNGITALAGGGQANAPILASAINRVTTVASGNDSVRLPAAVAGNVVLVANSAAANSMNVFPQSGESINALSANAAFAMAANSRAVFFCAVNGVWSAVLSA